MTKLFRDLGGSIATPQSDSRQFVEEARKQGFSMTPQDFFRFAEMAKGRDMGEVVRDLRESGDIDENTFQDLKQKAFGFINLIKMVSGR